ncbi:energy transducer TonB [Herbaspirillum sp. DW155]|uniref:energy transducer TonB n=1 Tax=Herbaspirillum sp. DW155 TaxID=3095609 RepID=UPI00308DF1C1|nr:energy transducer TonB [Herbaspirillum sp. DW155]
MRHSLTLPLNGPSSSSWPDQPPAVPSGNALRWPLAVGVALAVECAIVLLAWPKAPVLPEPVPEPVKVMKLVTIAEAPPLPEPAPPVPPPTPRPPKPVPPKPSPAPRPAPEMAAQNAPSQQAPAPAPSQPAAPVAAAPSAPAAPVTPAPKAQPGEVRRGLVPLQRVEPDYPPKALASNTEGVVIAHVTIEKDGSVSAVQIVRAQPPRLFDQAAIKALMQWKFSRTDEPVLGEVELRFSLN